jgi:hypothetical protein
VAVDTKGEQTLERENVLRKVRKLLDLAGNNPSVEEAASAAEKAQALITKYGLTLIDVDTERDAAGNEDLTRGYENVPFNYGGHDHSREWRLELLHRLAQLNFCQVIRYTWNRKYGTKAAQANKSSIIGQPGHIDLVVFLFESIARQLQSMANAEYTKAVREGHAWCSVMKWKKGFAYGAIEVILARLEAQRRELEGAPEVRALVVIADAQLVAATEKYFPKLKEGRERTLKVNGDAYYRGREAGQKVAINQALKEGRA